jgi:hypothetical protein
MQNPQMQIAVAMGVPVACPIFVIKWQASVKATLAAAVDGRGQKKKAPGSIRTPFPITL